MEETINDYDEYKKSEKEEYNKRKRELEDIKELLKIPCGLRFIKRLITEGKIFSTTFTGNSHTYFLEGHRNLALKFFSDICEVAPHKISDIIIDKEK